MRALGKENIFKSLCSQNKLDKWELTSPGEGFIDIKELKTVTMLLGTMLSKEELDDFMAEADVVSGFYLV